MPSFFPDRYKMAALGASCSRKCFELYKEKGVKARKIGANVDQNLLTETAGDDRIFNWRGLRISCPQPEKQNFLF